MRYDPRDIPKGKIGTLRADGTLVLTQQECGYLAAIVDLRSGLIATNSHKSKYSIHPSSEKMYQDVKKLIRWANNMKATSATQDNKMHRIDKRVYADRKRKPDENSKLETEFNDQVSTLEKESDGSVRRGKLRPGDTVGPFKVFSKSWKVAYKAGTSQD
ncbi:hypothetical protein Tco_0421966 [Tanacetum coccineum]